jgi:hypothetical protein
LKKQKNLCLETSCRARNWICSITGSGGLCRNFDVKKKVSAALVKKNLKRVRADMDDNVRNPKSKIEAQDQVKITRSGKG